jgi:hypothetical protein
VIKNKFESKEVRDKLKAIYESLCTSERFESIGNENKFYLISAKWVKNFYNFYKAIENGSKLDKLFERNRILLNYFGENDDREGMASVFPGPVDNFDLIAFKPSIPDTKETYSNIFLKNGMKESSDFIYVNSEGWKLIEELFGCNFKIERFKEILHDEEVIEVNLRRFKILILGNKLQKNEIFPKSIQISKAKTVEDLKNKIIRILEGRISTKAKFYLFNFGLKDRRNETFEMVYSYCNGAKKTKLKASLIENDKTSIEVFKIILS